MKVWFQYCSEWLPTLMANIWVTFQLFDPNISELFMNLDETEVRNSFACYLFCYLRWKCQKEIEKSIIELIFSSYSFLMCFHFMFAFILHSIFVSFLLLTFFISRNFETNWKRIHRQKIVNPRQEMRRETNEYQNYLNHLLEQLRQIFEAKSHKLPVDCHFYGQYFE